MRNLLKRMWQKGGSRVLIDYLTPKPETVQILLIRRGKPEAGIYLDEKREIRSPSLQNESPHAEPPARNR